MTLDPVHALMAAGHAAPGLDPQTQVGIAKTSKSLPEAVTNAQATFHFGNSVKAYDQLQQMSHGAQAHAWKAMSPAQQGSLRAVGYHPPNMDALGHVGAGGQHGGIWSSIANGVTGALHDVGHSLGEAADDTLGALGAPLRAVEHVVRAAHEVGEMGVKAAQGEKGALAAAQSSGVGPGFLDSFSDLFSPSAWAKSWRDTSNGETYVDPAIRRHLIGRYGRSQVNLAIRVSASSPDEIVQSAPQSRRQQLTQTFQDPKFQQLVQQVNNAKSSLGRNLVGSKFLGQHPAAGKVISGTLDGAFDIFADPTLAAGKAVKGIEAAKYGITAADAAAHLAGDASRADSVLNSSAVRRMTDYLGDNYLSKGDYGGLAKVDPRFDAIAPQLQRQGVDSGEKLRDFLSSEAGLNALLSGKAARIAHGVLVPHLTYAGWAKQGVKQALTKSLDFLADHPSSPEARAIALDAGEVYDPAETGAKAQNLEDLMHSGALSAKPGAITRAGRALNMARVVRSMGRLVPTNQAIDLTDANLGVADFRRFIQPYLTSGAVDDAVNVFIHADQGTRWRLVQAARDQLFHASGLRNTEAGRTAADKMLADYDQIERKQRYSLDGNDDLQMDNGEPQPSAVLETQLADKAAIPRFSAIRDEVRKQGILGALHVDPITRSDGFMKYWRASLLMRPGFALRFALDENMGRLLRHGPRQFLASYLANGAAKTQTDEQIDGIVDDLVKKGEIAPGDADAERDYRKAMAIKPILPYHPIERTLNVLAEHVPDGMRPLIEKPAQFYGAVLGAKTREWARKAERGGLKLLGKSDYIDAATHLYTHQPVSQGFADLLSAMHGAPADYWSPDAILLAMQNGSSGEAARFRQAGPFSQAETGDPMYKFKWQIGLDQIARSKLGRAALASIDKSPRTQERAVLKVLNDPKFAATKARFARAERMPDGKVAGVDADQGQVDRAFARTVVRHVNAHVRATDPKTGPILSDVVDEMLEHRRGPATETLENAIAKGAIPKSVFGPDLLELHGWQSWMTKGMEELVGKPANWLTRQPHFIQMYAEALSELRPYAEQIAGRSVGGRVVGEIVNGASNVDIPDGAVRLFRGESPDRVPSPPEERGRFWTPSYTKAKGYAGARGRVRFVDVSRDEAKRWRDAVPEYGHHGDAPVHRNVEPITERDLDAIITAQRTGETVPVLRREFFAPQQVQPEDAEKLLSDMAFHRATNEIIPYIHNPKLRTEFEEKHRILFPFLFAQRQFLQRWGRTFAMSPDGIRKLQLTMNGLRTSGFVQRDQNGDDYFYYPGAQYAQDLVTGALGAIGVHVSVPLAVPFTGQIQYLVPGLSNPITPSVGPFAAVGLKELGKLMPELGDTTQSILGEGASTPTWQSFTPSLMNRLWNALGPEQAGSQLASTTMQAIKELDANGYGLASNASPGEVEQYVSRVQNWARSLLVTRAALGFVLPATPKPDMDVRNLDSRLQTLMNQMPYDKAVTEFIREHPDATAYTVSETNNMTDGYTPATAASLKWLQNHESFAKDHPIAAAWLIPRSTGEFDPAAYREQIALGMRQFKELPGFLDNVVQARSANAYYNTLDAYNKAYDATTDSSTHQHLVNWWDNWKASFFKQNPIFRQYIEADTGPDKRKTIIDNVAAALEDPNVPDSPQVPHLRTMLDAYQSFVSDYNAYAGTYEGNADQVKSELSANILAWGKTYIAKHPDAADFWQTVIRPEITDVDG